MCEHTTGMHYRNNTQKLPVSEEIRSLPISKKRKVGRPKKMPTCLSRSPPRPAIQPPVLLDVSTENSEEISPAISTPAISIPVSVMCSACIEDGKEAFSVGYCGQCSDNLCQDCMNAHSRTRITKNHIITDPQVPTDVIMNE